MIEQQQTNLQQQLNQVQQNELPTQSKQIDIECPYRLISGHWMTLSRPQYQRTCGISSLVSIWNYQFSKIGLGDKDPISIEQAMLKLNLIGNGSVEESFRKKFKKTKELTEKTENSNDAQINEDEPEDPQMINADKTLHEYVNTIDFGCFTGNDTLLKWYRLLCRIYGGSGRSYIFYKTNSERSLCKNQEQAKKKLIEGLNSQGKTCFIYHACDHYFCPVGYEFMPYGQQRQNGKFMSSEINKEGNQLYIMVGQSSKMFPCMHNFKWSQIQLDLNTFWPQYYNIRRRSEGVKFYKGKQNEKPNTTTMNCIMAFEKVRD